MSNINYNNKHLLNSIISTNTLNKIDQKILIDSSDIIIRDKDNKQKDIFDIFCR